MEQLNRNSALPAIEVGCAELEAAFHNAGLPTSPDARLQVQRQMLRVKQELDQSSVLDTQRPAQRLDLAGDDVWLWGAAAFCDQRSRQISGGGLRVGGWVGA